MCTSSNIRICKLFLLLFLTACGTDDHPATTAKHPIKNIGHAGSGFNYLVSPFNAMPPNSFGSLVKALGNGADGVELDLQITADFKLVLFHDLVLEDRTNLSGPIPERNSNTVIGAAYTCGFPYDLFQDEHIIEFMKWIKYASELPEFPYLHVDLKTAQIKSPSMIDSMLVIMQRELKSVNYPLNKVFLLSVNPQIVKKTMEMDSVWTSVYDVADFQAGLKWAVKNQCKYLSIDQGKISASDVAQAQKKGVGIIIFGGKSKSTLEKIITMKPDFIQSNNVELLYELLH